MSGGAEDRFPPSVLREYALVADGERGALIGPRGGLVWMCAPRWDSDAVFSSLVGGRGVYAVTPAGRFVWGGYYEGGSLIWRSRWVTGEGIMECREALVLPGDPRCAVVLRRVMALDCTAEVRVVLDPRPGFGRHAVRSWNLADGVWSGRAGGLHLRWSGASGARPGYGGGDESALGMDLSVPLGVHHDLVLEVSAEPLADQLVDAEEAWRTTEHSWRDAVPDLSASVAPRDANQAYAVLRGLTGSAGGMVAATTTSLPERAETGRNYDYRYVWIRDQCYTGQAVAAAGPFDLLDDAVRFTTERLMADGAHLAPAYTVSGGRIPDQRQLSLQGYPGGSDLAGNWVNKQFQLDAFGETMLLLAAAARHDHLDGIGWRAAELAAEAVAERWQEPDAGIWEIDNRPWTHSRLICAAGLRSVSAVSPTPSLAASWSKLADVIVADTGANALHPSGRWQRSPGDEGMDGALLFPAIRGALPASDPRSVATLRAYEQDLTEEGYAYRFRHDSRPLAEAEGAFLLCGFIMALATHQQGDELAAVHWFERNRAACGPPGLFTEEFDVAERQLRGNLPQAFVHALLLEASFRLSSPWAGP